ncbi:hypothetical protein [Archaeoglobus veneficus]|uniref:hypothetical protein n=1 Tax=Archaeoglobus veneficus TaxID=58290 RepID=UPI00064F40C5|nr:hypothetical protein [Archaeoglobus veneficus]
MRDKLVKVFSKLEVLDFTYRDAVLAAEISGKLAKKGKNVGLDAVVAAIAVNNGCEATVKRNGKHFRQIRELIDVEVEVYKI